MKFIPSGVNFSPFSQNTDISEHPLVIEFGDKALMIFKAWGVL